MLADRHDVDQLGGIAIEIHHVGRLFGGLGAGVHRHAHIGLGQGRGVVGAIAGHRHHLSELLLLLNHGDLVLGSGFGDEVIHARFAGDHTGGDRVVAGEHHGADAHAAQLIETLADARLDDVLEVDHAKHLAAAAHRQGRAPQPRDLLKAAIEFIGHGAATRAHESLDRIHRPFAELDALGAVCAAHAGAGRELDAARTGGIEGQNSALFFGQPHD